MVAFDVPNSVPTPYETMLSERTRGLGDPALFLRNTRSCDSVALRARESSATTNQEVARSSRAGRTTSSGGWLATGTLQPRRSSLRSDRAGSSRAGAPNHNLQPRDCANTVCEQSGSLTPVFQDDLEVHARRNTPDSVIRLVVLVTIGSKKQVVERGSQRLQCSACFYGFEQDVNSDGHDPPAKLCAVDIGRLAASGPILADVWAPWTHRVVDDQPGPRQQVPTLLRATQ